MTKLTPSGQARAAHELEGVRARELPNSNTSNLFR